MQGKACIGLHVFFFSLSNGTLDYIPVPECQSVRTLFTHSSLTMVYDCELLKLVTLYNVQCSMGLLICCDIFLRTLYQCVHPNIYYDKSDISDINMRHKVVIVVKISP